MPELLRAEPIDLSALYQEITAELRVVELRCAELRGQLALIERLAAETRAAAERDDQ